MQYAQGAIGRVFLLKFMELTGIDAQKEPDMAGGLVMLRLAGGKKP